MHQREVLGVICMQFHYFEKSGEHIAFGLSVCVCAFVRPFKKFKLGF